MLTSRMLVRRELEVVELARLRRPLGEAAEIFRPLQLLARPHPDLDVVVERMAHLRKRPDRCQEAREAERPGAEERPGVPPCELDLLRRERRDLLDRPQ